MAVTTIIEKTLRDQLPVALHEHVPQLARLLVDVADGTLKSEEAQQRIDSMPSLAPLLRQLAGTQVEVGNTGISFGIGNDLRNATITVSGDIAGRDIINLQIALTVPPTNTSLRTVTPYVLALIGVLSIVSIVLFLRFRGEGKMQNVFNIAVADFGQIDKAGRVVPWNDGGIRKAIGISLSDEMNSSSLLKGIVDVRYEGVGLIQGDTPRVRADAARRLAESINATLIIYGNLQHQDNKAAFQPEFYINEEKLRNASELVGANQLGLAVGSTNPNMDASNIASELVLSNALKARTEALTFFTVGLAYLSIDRPDDAVNFLKNAIDTDGWADTEGKEVIYLFLGSAYIERNQINDLELAQEAYRKAIDLNPGYARAYIGLGNVFYEEFIRSQNTDQVKLAQARTEYERARAASDKSALGNVEAKVHLSLGNVYLVQAQMGQAELFTNARNEFEWITAAYQQGHSELKPYAAHASFGLGTIYERWNGDYAHAALYYQKAIDDAEDNTGLREQAQTQLAIVSKEIQATASPK